ncbi:MAG: hypothetical protein WCK55_09840 [Verrucomicrobiota bacterium]
MKHLKITALLAAAITFSFTACEKKVDEKTAIANFKTEVESVTKWADEKSKAASKDPMAGMTMVGEIVGKFKAIKTDGLPADLKSAWGEMTSVLGEMGDIFKNMPKIDASKPEDMGKVMGDLMPKMMAVQAKMEPIGKKLEELGKKYDIDLKKVANGGK